MAGQGADAAALIVARGGQLFADGTAACPITFTFEADPLDGSVSYDTRGQWGGVIVLGDATTNSQLVKDKSKAFLQTTTAPNTAVTMMRTTPVSCAM